MLHIICCKHEPSAIADIISERFSLRLLGILAVVLAEMWSVQTALRRMLSRLCFLFVAYLADGISSSTVHFPSASGSQSAAIAAVVQDVVDVELQISYHG